MEAGGSRMSLFRIESTAHYGGRGGRWRRWKFVISCHGGVLISPYPTFRCVVLQGVDTRSTICPLILIIPREFWA